MKVYIRYMILFSALFLFSCNDWLDLEPEGEATETDLFSTGTGYRSVLNGLYKSMGGPNLYGLQLQFGVLDCMAQMYEIDDKTVNGNELYRAAKNYDFVSNDLKPVLEAIWKEAYNVVANANNLIQNVSVESSDLFSGGEMERQLILGEAYACRALMHFDLLRLFAPSLAQEASGKNYLPYVEIYPNIQAEDIAVQPFLDKVIRDLKEARKLTATFDTTFLGQSYSADGNSRFYDDLINGMEGFSNHNADGFFQGRGYRMSYYAITALLARVCQYAGLENEAFQYAGEVIKFDATSEAGSKYVMYQDDFSGVKTTSGQTVSDFEKKSDLKVVSNLIFAVYNAKSYDDNQLLIHFTESGKGVVELFLIDRSKYFFRDGIDETADFRSQNMLFSLSADRLTSGKWYPHSDLQKREKNVTILPVIRATEMRYIIAEYYAHQNNYAEAYQILNDIRAKRGLIVPLSVMSSWEGFEKDLLHDARREWISEGQLFYLYKRLNAAFTIGLETRKLNSSEYQIPTPVKPM